MRQAIASLKHHIDHQRNRSPLFFISTAPEALLSYCTYLAGASNATDQIATGDAPEWYPHDVRKDHAVLLAYIKVEQLKLQRRIEAGELNPPSPMGGSPSLGDAMRRSDRLKEASENPEEDPEPFDEFTGPTGGAR